MLLNFLNKMAKSSIGKLVEAIVGELVKAKTLGETTNTRVVAAMKVMQLMGMMEELRLFAIILTADYGRLGVQTPSAITQVLSQSESALIEFPIRMAPAVPAPAKPVVAAAPAPMPAKPAPISASTPKSAPVPPATTPARTIKLEKSPEERRNTLFSILQGFVSGKTIKVPETAGFIASVVKSDTDSFSESQWLIVLEAVKKAARVHLPLFGEEVATVIFDMVPLKKLSDVVFGQDGLFVQTSAQLSDVGDGKPMPRGLKASCLTLANAVDAIDDRQEGRLDVHEVARVQGLVRKIEQIPGSDEIVSTFKSIIYDDQVDEPAKSVNLQATEKLENGARGAEALKALRSQLPANGHTAEAERLGTVAANAKASASAFAHAAQVN